MFYSRWIESSPLRCRDTFGERRWAEFEASRRQHNENICRETNKLVLRLDKLLNAEADKEADKTVVDWQEDQLVALCPFCAKAFSLARRRHHCRACGAVLCGSCSRFLEHSRARRLVRPAQLYADRYERIEERLASASAAAKTPIRVCEDCQRLLERRLATLDAHYSQPPFWELYAELRRQMLEADQLALAEEPTREMKTKTQALRQQVAGGSARLAKLAERESAAKQAHVLRAVCQSVVFWLSESVEAKAARVAPGQAPSGWVAQPAAGALRALEQRDEDPLLIQIRNLDEFIRQARAHERYEEVRSLEESKRDLEIEYLVQNAAAMSAALGAPAAAEHTE